MLTFDALDKKLIVQLDTNGRQSYAELARKLRHGSDIIRYRVQRLEEQKILGFVSATVDLYKLGFSVYKIYFNLSGKDPTELLNYLDKHPATYWLAEYYGSYEIQVSLAVKSPAEFLNIYDGIWERYSNVIRQGQVAHSVYVHRYPKRYLSKSEKSRTVQDSSGKIYEPSELELKILVALFKNARLSNVELAKKLKTTPTVISYWIEKLEAAGVILGYRMQLNYKKAEVMLFKLLVNLEKQDNCFIEAFSKHCEFNPNITCYMRQIAPWSIECEIEVPNYEMIHQFIDEIRSKFSENIREIEYLVLKTDYYHRFPLSTFF